MRKAISIDRRHLVALAATCALAPASSLRAFAEVWPARPVRVVVPYAPGGSTDTVARITADRLSNIWGQQRSWPRVSIAFATHLLQPMTSG